MDHNWKVHPQDCPAKEEGKASCNTFEHWQTAVDGVFKETMDARNQDATTDD